MKTTRFLLTAALGAVLGASVAGSAALAAPAGATPARACHKLFMSAKKDGSLNGQTYAAFKAAKCQTASSASTASSTAPTGSESGSASKTPAPKMPVEAAPASEQTSAAEPVKKAAPVSAPSAAGVVFPTAIAPEFAKLTAGRARMKTCVAQYNANKATGRNGQLKWIQRGGGYWSECNTRLKNIAP